mgnify:CR=1 FL=1
MFFFFVAFISNQGRPCCRCVHFWSPSTTTSSDGVNAGKRRHVSFCLDCWIPHTHTHTHTHTRVHLTKSVENNWAGRTISIPFTMASKVAVLSPHQHLTDDSGAVSIHSSTLAEFLSSLSCSCSFSGVDSKSINHSRPRERIEVVCECCVT